MEAISFIVGVLVFVISYYIGVIILYLFGESFRFLSSKAKVEEYTFQRPKISNPIQRIIRYIKIFPFWLQDKKRLISLIASSIKDIFWFLKLMTRSDSRIKNAFIAFCSLFFLSLFISFLFLDYASTRNFFYLFQS